MKIKINWNIIGLGIMAIILSVILTAFNEIPIRLEDYLFCEIVLLLSILISILCENWDNLFKKKKEDGIKWKGK